MQIQKPKNPYPKITALTKENEHQLRDYLVRWTQIMCNTEPIDREQSEYWLAQAYKMGSLPIVPVIFCSSPVAIEIVKVAQTNKSLGQKTDWFLIGDELEQKFGANSEKIIESAKKSLERCENLRVGNTTIHETWVKIWEETGIKIRNAVSKPVRSKTVSVAKGINIWAQIISSLFPSDHMNYFERGITRTASLSRSGYPLPHFISYDFYRESLGLVEETAKIAPLLEQMKTGSYFSPFRSLCLASERPAKLNIDDRGRLHSANAPAVEYADGVKSYAIHGISVSEKIIEHWDEVTGKDIDKEQNVEVRRVLIEKYGFAEYIMETGAKLVQEDKYGQLYRKDRKRWEEPIVMVKVKNSTPEPDGTIKDYYIRAHWNCRTAHEAVANSFGKTAANYNPLVET